MEQRLPDSEVRRLRDLAEAASPSPWRAMIEGRDHFSGESFIMIGREDDRDEDLYLSRDSGPGSPADHDFIAMVRNSIGLLLDELEFLRIEIRRSQDSEPTGGHAESDTSSSHGLRE
jgi:hypothetical protein